MIKIILFIIISFLLFTFWCMLRIASISDNEMINTDKDFE